MNSGTRCDRCGLEFVPDGVGCYAGQGCTCHRTIFPEAAAIARKQAEMQQADAERMKRQYHAEMEKNNAVDTQMKRPVMQGWQCPVCGTVHAPFVKSCDRGHSK